MKVYSDKFKKYKEEREENAKEYGLSALPMPECVPVDLYGKRVTLEKNDPDNLKNIAEDIQKFYGLEQ
jgi:hypothetical protein